MEKSKVALVRCESYDNAQVLISMLKGIDLLGGIARFVKPGEKIVLKPNLLLGSEPEKCVTTHPAVFRAAGQLLKEAGAIVMYGDSPGFGKCEPNMKKSGLKQVGEEMGFTIADFDEGRAVSHKNALLVKNLTIANGVLDNDGLISLPKLKAHGLMRYTGAVKNQFGCVPGLLKGQYHVKLPDPYDFAAMLIDINTSIKPRLYVMDGIMAMEGNGPRSGNPIKMNVILVSTDPVALDAVACRMIDVNPEVVPTAKAGEKAGLGTYHAENIEILGDPLASFINKTFTVNRTPPDSVKGGRVRVFIKNRITQRPVIDKIKCTHCGTCVRMCPVEPKAVDWVKGDKTIPPKHNYNRCIRCYCCQETCPEGAISVATPWLARLMRRM